LESGQLKQGFVCLVNRFLNKWRQQQRQRQQRQQQRHWQ
jgi:hypothetical protein